MPTVNYPGVNIASVFPSLGPTVERGMAQGMRASQGSLSGASNRSLITRTGHRSKKAFSRCKVIIPTFYIPQTGTAPFVDLDLPVPLSFECAIEPNFLESLGGLAASPKYDFKFNGSITATYAGPGTNNLGYIESDWLYLPTLIAADQKFGIFYNEEAATSAANQLPLDNRGGSSFVNRNEGNSFVATSQLGMLKTINAITAFSSTQLGGSAAATPAMLIIDYDVTDIVPAIEGDSIAQGVGQGEAGSPSNTDILGNVLRNSGYPAQLINEKYGLNYAINLGKATDGAKFKALPNALRYRAQLLRRANPSHIFQEDGVNDLSGGVGTNAVKTWAVYNASTNPFYNRGDVVVANSNLYVCTRGGNPSTTAGGPSGTTPFTDIVEGTNRWQYLLPDTSTNRTAATAYARYLSLFDLYRVAVPGVKITKALVTPQAQSTDSFATIANQTVSAVTPNRDALNSIFARQATDPVLGIVAFFDPGLGVEYNDGSGTRTGKWAVAADRTATTGTASYNVNDGTHANGQGVINIVAAAPASVSAVFPN